MQHLLLLSLIILTCSLNQNITEDFFKQQSTLNMSSIKMKKLDKLIAMDSIKGKLIPKLNSERYKGQNGKVGIVGGSVEYCGAPFYAAMGAVRTGADLGYIFCTQGAAIPIKSYGPEIIVFPYLYTTREARGRDEDVEEDNEKMMDWVSRLDSIVIGPGLGRDDHVQETVGRIIQFTRDREIPTVLDADALWTVKNNVELVRGNPHVILTPNIVEFGRLWNVVFVETEIDTSNEGVMALANELGNVTILLKGKTDMIANGQNYITCGAQGGMKRAGGQGDVLSGSLGTFSAWLSKYNKEHPDSDISLLHSAYAASRLTKSASRNAFEAHGRSLSGLDLLPQIHTSFEEIFPEQN